MFEGLWQWLGFVGSPRPTWPHVIEMVTSGAWSMKKAAQMMGLSLEMFEAQYAVHLSTAASGAAGSGGAAGTGAAAAGTKAAGVAVVIVKVLGVLVIIGAIVGGTYMAVNWGEPSSDPISSTPTGRGIVMRLVQEHRARGPSAAYTAEGVLSSVATYVLTFELENDSGSALTIKEQATVRGYGNGGVVEESKYNLPSQIAAGAVETCVFHKVTAPKERGFTWMLELEGEAFDEAGKLIRVVAKASGGGE